MNKLLEQKINTYLEDYKNEQATFKKFVTIFNFVEFLNINSDTHQIISPIIGVRS